MDLKTMLLTMFHKLGWRFSILSLPLLATLYWGATGCTEKCKPGEERRCGLEIGACRAGWQLCNNIGFWDECLGAVGPVAEICDGLDNDCNGAVDDIVSRFCSNNCGSQGEETCVNGQWSCSAPTPLEICGDLIDNDCDGSVDEGCSCTHEQKCGLSEGQCKQGIQNCFDGILTPCRNYVGPSEEVCDNADNDCDGQTDEGLSGLVCDNACGPGLSNCINGKDICEVPPAERACPGECGPQRCIDGAWTPCAGTPEGSIPDGKDNDCNGIIDDITRPCAINNCTYGSERFVNGKWSGCIIPEEICDGKDNNCNGQVDEDTIGKECINENAKECGTGKTTCVNGVKGCDFPEVTLECTNACGSGALQCINGIKGPCQVLPITISCTTACGEGIRECKNGILGKCSADPKAEVCNGADDNCDGFVDNKSPDGKYLTKICAKQCEGDVTVPGEQECTDGKWSECSPSKPCPL